jgi:hypothetical protein
LQKLLHFVVRFIVGCNLNWYRCGRHEVGLTQTNSGLANGVGPYQPATDDWAAIEAAAILEGKVTIYANSGGVEDLPDAWYALYPGLVSMPDTDGIDTKMQAEQERECHRDLVNSDGHIV